MFAYAGSISKSGRHQCRFCKEWWHEGGMVKWGTLDHRITPLDPRHFWPSHVCNECHGKAIDRLREKEKLRRAEERRQRLEEHARRRALEEPRLPRRKAEAGVSHQTIRMRRLMSATPTWVDIDELDRVYDARDRLMLRTGIPHHVDHILPLAGLDVCGLHVPWNLRIMPARENIGKGIKWSETDGLAPAGYDGAALPPLPNDLLQVA